MDINLFNFKNRDDRNDDFEDEGWNKFMSERYPDYRGGEFVPKTDKTRESYDFLEKYSDIFNQYTASTPQPNPYSNHAMFIIDVLSKMNVKFRIDVFPYTESFGRSRYSSINTSEHSLINIIAEPNPLVQGAALVFCAHHDVANIRSNNCQDNKASVCNLLRLVSLISQNPDDSQRTLVLFSDCEETGARGAEHFAKEAKEKEKPYGEISGVINLELTGKGNTVWTDCSHKRSENLLHAKLEDVAGKEIPKLHCPPSDALAFRRQGFPVLCIGILPDDDLKTTNTWRICHSMKDEIEICSRTDMNNFVEFLHNVSKNKENKLPEVILLPAEQAQLTLEL